MKMNNMDKKHTRRIDPVTDSCLTGSLHTSVENLNTSEEPSPEEFSDLNASLLSLAITDTLEIEHLSDLKEQPGGGGRKRIKDFTIKPPLVTPFTLAAASKVPMTKQAMPKDVQAGQINSFAKSKDEEGTISTFDFMNLPTIADVTSRYTSRIHPPANVPTLNATTITRNAIKSKTATKRQQAMQEYREDL